MRLISFSFYKSYFYFILVIGFDIANSYIREFLDNIYTDHEHANLTFELINIICFIIADLLAGFLVLYTYRSSKSEKVGENKVKKKNKNPLEQELIFTDLSKRKNKYKLIILISILEFVSRFIDLIFFTIFEIKKVRNGEIAWLISFDFLSRVIFSHFILKLKIHRHHCLTIIITIFSLIFMSVSAFIAIDDKDLRNWPCFISLSLKFIISSFEDVLNKYLFNEKFLLPHTLIFFRGIFNGIMFLIIIPIIILVKGFIENNENLKIGLGPANEDVDVNVIWKILLTILYTIIYFIRTFCVMKVIYIFTPQYVSFLNELFNLFILLRCRIKFKDNLFIIVGDSICMVFIILSTLIFNEILILNFCGLNDHTKSEMKLKEKKETDDLNISCDSDNSDVYTSFDSALSK